MFATRNKYKLTSLTVLIVSVMLAAVRTVLLIKNVEIASSSPKGHYLISINPATVAFCVLAISFAIAVFVWCYFFLSKQKVTIFEPLKPGCCVEISLYPSTLLFTTALAGFMLLSSGVYFAYLYLFDNVGTIWHFILSILLIASSSGFICATFKAKSGNAARASVWFKLITVLLAVYWLLHEFIDQNEYAINSASVIHILSLMLMLLFFTNEAQNAAGKLRPKVYCTTAMLTVLFLFLDALPDLILSCFWMFKLDVFVLLDAICLVFALYAFAKVFCAIPEGSKDYSAE